MWGKPYPFLSISLFCSCHLRKKLTVRPSAGGPRKEEARDGRWRRGVADLMEVSGLTPPPPHRQHPGHLCGLGGGTGAAMSFTTCSAWERIPVLVPQPGSRLLHCFSGPRPSGQALPRPWEAQKGIQAQTAGKLLFVAGRAQGHETSGGTGVLCWVSATGTRTGGCMMSPCSEVRGEPADQGLRGAREVQTKN